MYFDIEAVLFYYSDSESYVTELDWFKLFLYQQYIVSDGLVCLSINEFKS